MHGTVNLDDKIQEGFIMHLDGDLARVKVAPNAECDNCGSCDIVHMEIMAYNPVMAQPGQKIKFRMIEKNMLMISIMVFLLPLLSILAGLYAGSMAAAYLNFNEPALMAAGALTFLAAAIYAAYLYDRNYKQNKANLPRILEIIR